MDSKGEYAELSAVGGLLAEVKSIVFWDISPKIHHSLADGPTPMRVSNSSKKKKSHEVGVVVVGIR